MNEYIQKIVLILLNLVTQIVNQAIFVSPLSDSQNAKAVTSIFAISLLLYIVISIGAVSSTIINKQRFSKLKEQKRLLIVILGHIITTVAGLAYLIGDNIAQFVTNYQSDLGCSTKCLESVGNAGSTLLVISLVLFGIVPTFIHGATTVSNLVYDVRVNLGYFWSPWRAAGHSIALIVQLDAWFSIISGLQTNSDSFCPSNELDILWVLYGVTIVIWGTVLVVIFAPGIIEAIMNKKMIYRKIFKITLIAVVIWFCSGVAIIADNDQPIGCLFECDFTTENRTNVCKEVAQHGTRIGLLFIALIPLAVMSFSIFVHWIKKMRQLYSTTSQENKQPDIKNVELNSISEVEEKGKC